MPQRFHFAKIAYLVFSASVQVFAVMAIGVGLVSHASGDEPFIPRRQSQPPGPPLSPQAALAKMVVPEGFRVELVACEPDLVNPVAMAFDDRGRIFVTESFEYPRLEAGPGRDRIKILEDTNGDGRFDSVKIFAEGLNIPSGIAVGHGGVWVANAPDILFLEDTNGDDRADKQTVVVTGFGRDDTHELPNALTWGPDGYLYGLNGVFNRSVVKQNDQVFDFTCAMFRIDPVTHRFELFCEGTSNPWGIAFDHEGEAFISACVIDHLWHLTESGYYHRQGGPYPPHTWKIDSIVKHKHQMAAYCGIEFFDSPAYPEEYRSKFYMGNIHGGCINVDSVSRKGSTYQGAGHPDFLTANDVWFMPVAQKVGPDGCLYVLDWYDRYHCYQDANADPKGIDRGHGRLYRVVYQQRPEIEHKDLVSLEESRLVELLDHANIFYRQRAAVILQHRLRSDRPAANGVVFDAMLRRLTKSPASASMQLLTTVLSAPQLTLPDLKKISELFKDQPLGSQWCVRALGERATANLGQAERSGDDLFELAVKSADPRVRLQVAIAAGKQARGAESDTRSTQLLLDVLSGSQDDGLLPRIVWKNLEPRLVAQQAMVVKRIGDAGDEDVLLIEMAARIATRLLDDVKPDLAGQNDRDTLTSTLRIADSLAKRGGNAGNDVLGAVLAKFHSSEIRTTAAAGVLTQWLSTTATTGRYQWQFQALAGDAEAQQKVGEQLLDRELAIDRRRQMLETAAMTHPSTLLAPLTQWISDMETETAVNDQWRDGLLTAIVRRGDEKTQQQLISQLARLPVGARAMVAGRMVQSESTARLLLGAISTGTVAKDILGPDQIRQLASSASVEIKDGVKAIWGSVRMSDSADRQKVVKDTTEYLLKQAHGDAKKGWLVYDRICGQCHVLHNRGYEVGPDISRNGRGNFEQLIVSVFDPSLVIGEAYKSVTVLTVDGRVISGLAQERSAKRIVLKVQGGKLEIVPMDEVDEVRDNAQSLMPEGLETQMSREELADLFALLSIENPADSSSLRVIAGTPEGLHSKP